MSPWIYKSGICRGSQTVKTMILHATFGRIQVLAAPWMLYKHSHQQEEEVKRKSMML